MHLFKLGIPAVLAISFLSWIFLHEDRTDYWEAISPAYLAEAENDLATLPPSSKPAPFCFELHREGIVLITPACKTFLERHPHQDVCAFQNLKVGQWDPEILDAEPSKSAAAIFTLAQSLQCKTVIVDIESLKKESRARFSDWIKNIAGALHSHGIAVSVAVHAKVDDAGSWEGAAAQDWPALCASADELLLMAYDFHFPGATDAGEEAPLDWVEKVLRYARTTCSPSHLRLGLAAYGYKWPTKTAVTERETGAPSKAMPAAPYFVETAAAREQKMKLAASYGVRKFFLWAMGMTARR